MSDEFEGDDILVEEFDFEKYAREKETLKASLESFIKDLKIERMGGICPFQAEGRVGEYEFYFRERGGWSSLKLDRYNPVGFEIEWMAGKNTIEFLGLEEFPEVFIDLLKNLEKAQFLYEFVGKKVDISKDDSEVLIATETDEDELYYGWGHSIEEAIEDMNYVSDYLLEHGFSEDFQKEINFKKNINPVPLNRDTRTFGREPDYSDLSFEEWKEYFKNYKKEITF